MALEYYGVSTKWTLLTLLNNKIKEITTNNYTLQYFSHLIMLNNTFKSLSS